MIESKPIRFVNGAGEERWQPALANGQRLVLASAAWEVMDAWSSREEGKPVLYKSRRRAERVGRREAKREWREETIHTWREADDD